MCHYLGCTIVQREWWDARRKPTGEVVAWLGMNLQQAYEFASVCCAVGDVQGSLLHVRLSKPLPSQSDPDWYLIDIWQSRLIQMCVIACKRSTWLFDVA